MLAGMSINRVRTITVFVADQDRAKTFYVDRLGFEVRTDQTAGDDRWLEVAPGGAQTTFVLHQPFPGTSAGTAQGLILESDDLAGDVAALRAAGVEVDGPNELPWGAQATVSDPDGNTLVLAASA